MKRQILPVIFVTILAFLLGTVPAICGKIDKNIELKEYYENYINEKILKCHSKARLRESTSAHLQNYAVREIKKAIFLSENKELLIKEMVKREIGVKQYKIEYFLNSQFYGNNETLQGKLF